MRHLKVPKQSTSALMAITRPYIHLNPYEGWGKRSHIKGLVSCPCGGLGDRQPLYNDSVGEWNLPPYKAHNALPHHPYKPCKGKGHPSSSVSPLPSFSSSLET